MIEASKRAAWWSRAGELSATEPQLLRGGASCRDRRTGDASDGLHSTTGARGRGRGHPNKNERADKRRAV